MDLEEFQKISEERKMNKKIKEFLQIGAEKKKHDFAFVLIVQDSSLGNSERKSLFMLCHDADK